MNANPSLNPTAGPTSAKPHRRVTDAATRTFHWLFALSFLGAYITADGERWRDVHMMLGYLMIGLLAARVVWGLVGPKRAKLSSLAGRISSLKMTVIQLKSGQSPWTMNWTAPQNAFMAALIALLLVTTVPLVLSGYLTNAEIAGELMEELHEFFGEFYLFLVLAHLGLIALLSLIRRRNLANPMITGYVFEKGPDLIKNNHAWLAMCLIASSLVWCVYYLSV